MPFIVARNNTDSINGAARKTTHDHVANLHGVHKCVENVSTFSIVGRPVGLLSDILSISIPSDADITVFHAIPSHRIVSCTAQGHLPYSGIIRNFNVLLRRKRFVRFIA